MSEQKKPQAGEWWVENNTHGGYGIVRVVGCDSEGGIVFEYRNDDVDARSWSVDGYEESDFLSDFRHEPRCTGFDWTPPAEPEPSPERKAIEQRAIVLGIDPLGLDSEDVEEMICLRLSQMKQPAESPDDWVTQDLVPPRHGRDQWCWIPLGTEPTEPDWVSREGNFAALTHGYKDEFDELLHVRCRRRDLPVVEPPKTDPTKCEVRLWTDGQMLPGRASRVVVTHATDLSNTMIEIKTPGGFYVEIPAEK